MPATLIRFGPLCLIMMAAPTTCLAGDIIGRLATPSGWRQHDIRRPKPPVVEPAEGSIARSRRRTRSSCSTGRTSTPGSRPRAGPPRWKVADGVLETVPGTGPIETKAKFGDIQLHVEWAAPDPPHGVGQDRGNSGVFLMGQFEIQVLDSYQADTYADGQAGAIYGQYPPLFNASRPPGAVADLRHRLPPPAVRRVRQAPGAGADHRLPQRHPRPEQRGAVRPDLLAQVAALRAGATAARSSSRTTTTRSATATSGSASCPSAPPRGPGPRPAEDRHAPGGGPGLRGGPVPRGRKPNAAGSRGERAPDPQVALAPRRSSWSRSPRPTSSCRTPTPASPSRRTIRAA